MFQDLMTSQHFRPKQINNRVSTPNNWHLFWLALGGVAEEVVGKIETTTSFIKGLMP